MGGIFFRMAVSVQHQTEHQIMMMVMRNTGEGKRKHRRHPNSYYGKYTFHFRAILTVQR
jgi:hypothetical protein